MESHDEISGTGTLCVSLGNAECKERRHRLVILKLIRGKRFQSLILRLELSAFNSLFIRVGINSPERHRFLHVHPAEYEFVFDKAQKIRIRHISIESRIPSSQECHRKQPSAKNYRMNDDREGSLTPREVEGKNSCYYSHVDSGEGMDLGLYMSRMIEVFRYVRLNERLEFMGDAVLQLWSSNAIFPLNLSEGKMTRLRAQLVCEHALAVYGRELHLNDFLLLGTGEEKTGGRNKEAIIADMFEAFLGALYLDAGMGAVDNILNEVLLPRVTHPEDIAEIDYKTKLQEYVQADSRRTVHYELVSEVGPSNAPEFTMSAVVDGLIMGTGRGSSKKQAEQNAAKNAFEKMEIHLEEKNTTESLIRGVAAGLKERYLSVLQKTLELFGDSETKLFSAPGRTEVGGNHTDHQLGRVLAASINLDTIAAVVPSSDNVVRLASRGFEIKPVDISDTEIHLEEKNTTESLIRGVAAGLKERGYNAGGFMAYSESDVIAGGGMSSSAAFEVLLGTIQSYLYNEGKVSPEDIAKIGQYAENVYFMKASGLMDQMASSVGSFVAIDFYEKEAPVVLSDEYSAVPNEMKGVARRLGQEVLSRCTIEDLLKNVAEIREKCGDRAFLRAYHFLNETKRADDEKNALLNKDIETFLKLVRESGYSSWMYLQNICVPGSKSEQPVALGLALSDAVLGNEGAYRVHGGGFAGTIQAFVPKAKTEEYIRTLEAAFGEGCCYILKIRGVGGTEVI